jgi:hypothetical protein
MRVHLILSFLFILTINSHAIDGTDSSIDIQASDLAADILSDSHRPIHAIISMDISASMYGTEYSKSSAIEIIKSFINKNNRTHKIGYVGWRQYPVKYSNLSSNYEYLINNISQLDFKGNTCFREGLSKSIELLENASTPQSRNIIIIISDGMENCNRTEVGNLTCDRIRDIIPDNTEVYTIQTTDTKNKSELLSCLNLNSKKYSNNDTNIGSQKGVSTQKEIPADISSRNPFSLTAIGKAIKFQDTATKVNVTKIVEQGDYNGPRIRIRIEAPDGPNVSNALVMALDSSGSLGTGGNPLYSRNLREAMNPALEEIGTKLQNSTIAIQSWDSDVDFTYGFSPISTAIGDIKKGEYFVSNPFYMTLFNVDLPIHASSDPYPVKHYHCDEQEATDFDTGLSAAVHLFEGAFPYRNGEEANTATKTIIFITARSEFMPFTQDYINEAKKKENNITIYTVGIGVKDGSEMQKNLTDISIQTGGTYHYSSGSSTWTSKAILDEISSIIEEIRAKKLMDNITVVDTIYPYLDVINSTIKVTKNGRNLNYSSIQPVRNLDGTTTLEIKLKEILARGENIEVSIDTKMNLSLPIDVSESRRNLYWNIDKSSRISSVTYHWHTDNWYEIHLPENSMSF